MILWYICNKEEFINVFFCNMKEFITLKRYGGFQHYINACPAFPLALPHIDGLNPFCYCALVNVGMSTYTIFGLQA